MFRLNDDDDDDDDDGDDDDDNLQSANISILQQHAHCNFPLTWDSFQF